MHDLLFGTWGGQIIAFCKQQPWALPAAITVFSVVMGLILGARGIGGSDSGGTFSDSDGGGCGGD